MPSGRNLANTTFRSLRVRNYRFFYIGQSVTLCGRWMQTVALGYLATKLSDANGVVVGALIALQFVPTLLLGAWAGVLADRMDKRKLLIMSQAAMALVSVALAAIVLADVVELWMLFVIVVALGLTQAVDVPTRQSFVSEMVGPDDLANAIGLNSALFQLARIIGPAFAGVLLVTTGPGLCFTITAVSYVSAIFALTVMRGDELFRGKPVERSKGQVREGLRYINATPELRNLLLLTLVVGVFAINSPVVLPLLADVTFGDLDLYSWMTVAMGAGALVGSLVVAHRARPTGKVQFLFGMVFGLAMLVAAAAPTVPLFVLLCIPYGLGQIAFLATSNSLIQLRADPHMRGRVMAVYSITILGSTPIGGPLVGWICDAFGPRYGLAIGAVATIAGTLYFVPKVIRSRGGEARIQPAEIAAVEPPVEAVLDAEPLLPIVTSRTADR